MWKSGNGASGFAGSLWRQGEVAASGDERAPREGTRMDALIAPRFPLRYLVTMASSPPTVSFLLSHPAHLIACGFGSGLSPWAPGTAGTLFAWMSYGLVRSGFSEAGFLGFLTVAFLLGFWVCQRTGRALGVADHGSIVWDEIVPFWFVLFMAPAGLGWQALAFGLFRLFDITKPWPARYFDRQQKNGFGVMMDDLCAALYSILVLAIFRFFIP